MSFVIIEKDEGPNYVLFWKGKLSQWYLCKFVAESMYESKAVSRTYNCCEQYMMSEKAKLFGDEEAFNNIMKSTDPKQQKEIGRRVKNFDLSTWNIHAKDIVMRGNRAKFSQNKKLKQLLLGTGISIIAEASPYDTIWGIGLSHTDVRAKNMDEWPGKNLLGKCLMAIRDELLMKS